MNALFIIAGLSIASLLAEIFNAKKWLTTFIILGIAAAIAVLIYEWNDHGFHYENMVMFDSMSVAFMALILVTGLFWFLISGSYLRSENNQVDRTALVLFAMVGALILTIFNNLVMLFLGIEILSISLYVLAGSRKEISSTEAAFKYLLMGSFATGFLLFGIALIYGATGLFHLDKMAGYLATQPELPAFFYVGLLMLLVGLTFKISAVPFHFWAPDVYSGSPTAITALMATVVKMAALAAFIRIFSTSFIGVSETWSTALSVITILTLVLPNVTAVYQTQVKRLLAYSSVGHVGYILLAFIADPTSSAPVIFYYLITYAVASLSAFVVLIHYEKSEEEELSILHFNGLYRKNPMLAVVMTIALLSLAGIPPLAGFFGKYLVFAHAIQNGYITLTLVAVVTSLIGAYYYFKIIIAMYLKEPSGNPVALLLEQKIVLVTLAALVFLVALFPDHLISLIN